MQRDMSHKSEEIGQLAKALAGTQAELRGALKDAQNPFFKSKYADLESVWEAARGPLSKNGLAISQTTEITEKGPVLTTWLIHASGEWISGQMPIISSKSDAQSLGAAITYARRFALAAIVGIVQTDDDGETAVGRISPGTHEKVEKTTYSAQIFDPKDLPAPIWDSIQEPARAPTKPEATKSRHSQHLASQNQAIGLPGDYVAKLGKKDGNVFGKMIKNIPEKDLLSFVKWLEDDSKEKQRPISALGQEFIKYADAFLNEKTAQKLNS